MGYQPLIFNGFLIGQGSGGGGGGGANNSLSNLTAPTAINVSLLPGSTGINLGSSAFPFEALYLQPTTSTTAGVIHQNGSSLLHTYGDSTSFSDLFLGYGAGNFSITNVNNNNNIGIGLNALHALTTSRNNIAIGPQALSSMNTGSGRADLGGNIAIGPSALTLNAGQQNIAIGYQNSTSNTNGSYNTVIGSQSFTSNTSGEINTLIGLQQFQANTTGSNNTFIGAESGQSHQSGQYNTGLGFSVGNNLVTGVGNTALGTFTQTTGDNNFTTALGFGAQAGQDNAIIIGGQVGVNNVSTNPNIGIGTITPNTSSLMTFDTTVSGFVPIVINSATLVGTPVTGAIEFDGTNLYYTDNTPTRQTLATTGSSGANNALSNLTPTAINVDLVPGATNTYSLGTPSNYWLHLYANQVRDTADTVVMHVANRQLRDPSNNSLVDFSTANTLLLNATTTIGTSSTTPTHNLNTSVAVNAGGTGTLFNLPTGYSGNPAGFITININGNPQIIPYW